MDSQSGETKRKKRKKEKENEGSSSIILFLSFIPTCSVFAGNFRRSAQNVDKSHYPGPPHFSARFRFIRPRVKTLSFSTPFFFFHPPWHDFPTLRSKKKKNIYGALRSSFLNLNASSACRGVSIISRCSSDRKRKIAVGAVNTAVKFSVITKNCNRHDASAVQRNPLSE